MVKVKEDLTGKKFGKLTVIEQAEDKIAKNGNHIAMWKCLCDCQENNPNPNYVYKAGSQLKAGKGLSCGCYKLEEARQRQTKDLTGIKFGKLTVLELSHYYKCKNGHHHAVWKCICECQKDKENPEYTYVLGYCLTNGNTKSCGCYRRENTTEMMHLRRTENRYEKCNEYYIGYTSKDEPFYFDECDYELVKKYKWMIGVDGYVYTTESYQKQSSERIAMHRLIMGLNKGDVNEVDHILGKPTRNDNRRYNLRIATISQNNINQPIRKDNTSGIKGVNWDSKEGKWRARIQIEKKRFNLGSYDDIQDAADARKTAEDILHGDFSYHNSQLIGNQRLQLFEKLYGAKDNNDIENIS